ncbi:hypothetical protein B0T16DRAFT_444199 [Cercophora newfieldiana]|uniref:Tyrosinase copper-binding domain-containing protein n=1 Tax=Cercophora newfieldiana TaxID=92897 RepID=A0AA39YAN0_9PEZI|nr:hypothetical protein B0T16DRAFT_444199 [Cercophora newfieldiana]
MVATKQLSWLLWAVSLVTAPAAAGRIPKREEFSQEEIVKGDALAALASLAYNETIPLASAKVRRTFGGSCNLSNVKVRQEWRTLSVNQRKNYIAAVKCLRNKPSILAPGVAPGSKSLFDDFVAIHLQQTIFIHLTGNFLIWHRYFTHVYEQHLQQCGYTGAAPYWEWGLDVNNPAASPVFDGSATSLGGNGQYIPHQGMILTEPLDPTALIPTPPGTGGGCVTTGPFANMVVNIGAVALAQYGTSEVYASPDPLADGNQRCLKRDLNAGIAKRYTSFYNTTSLILSYNNIEKFQAHMQADPRYVHGELGVHGGGHFTIGGDPGGDPFISPGDPAFYLHHGQIDRVYWIWQALDFNNRKNVHGSNVFMDIFPSANTTVEDIIDISPLAPPVKIKDLMNTLGGTPLCYVYL